MKNQTKKRLAMALAGVAVVGMVGIAQPKAAEAGWLGDVIGKAIGTMSGGKAVSSDSATQKDKILMKAIESGDYDLVEHMIKDGANVNAFYDNKMPMDAALSRRRFNGDSRFADLLIANGADLEGWVHNNEYHYYAFCYGPAQTAYLIDKGLKLTFTNGIGANLLMYFITCSYYSEDKGIDKHVIVQELVNRGLNVNARISKDWNAGSVWCYAGDTPLMMAVRKWDIETAKILLYAGAKLNARNDSGETALDIATSSGNMEMIKLLYSWQK